MELGNAQSAATIKTNDHSNNDNYTQGRTGFKIKNGEEQNVILKKEV